MSRNKPLSMALVLAQMLLGGIALGNGNPDNGRAGQMSAFYDGQTFTINFKELASNAEVSQLLHNGSINTIYMSDTKLPGDVPFVAVLDAIQGDGFNPLWQEVDIMFNAGVTPFQLTSDTDVLAAAAAQPPLITLIPTTEVYRCSVVGPGPK